MHLILVTGALLVGLPILLHLIMRQEPKKLPFPAFRFLKLKRRINQRKMRLRHFLLLLLRMLLIGLIALALFQPTLLSDRFNIKGEQPIACVIVIDTSPSMAYVLAVDRSGLSEARQRGPILLEEDGPEDRKRPWTAMDEARFRALELIDELPPGSKVAVVDTADRDSYWALSLPEVRKKIREMRKPKASSRSVSQTLPLAYQLFSRLEQEAGPGQETMPRLLCVFSDRTSPSWDSSQSPYLLEMKGNVPKPEIMSAYVDVGIEKPLNMAITGIEMKPQLVPADKPIEFTVIVEATGAAQENKIQVRLADDSRFSQTERDELSKRFPSQSVTKFEPGFPSQVTFRSTDKWKPGLYQWEVSLVTPDALPADDVRYLTFRVREPRKILAVGDPRPALAGALGGMGLVWKTRQESAWTWRSALDALGYSCEVTFVPTFLDMKPAQLAQYEAIVFVELINPSTDLWDKASTYVEGGGKLVVVPGVDDMLTDGPGRPPPGYSNKLLPGTFKNWIELDQRAGRGMIWAWNALKAHPMLADFKEWLKNSKIDFVANPPQTWGYWEVEPRDKLSVIVSYADDADADKRRPALLESSVGQRGKVILFTTATGGRRTKDVKKLWNDYASSSFHLVLTYEIARYLTGESEDLVLNYTSGESVLVKWPLDAAARSKIYYLSGPDVGDKESELIHPDGETILRLGPDRLKSAGNYEIISDPSDKKPDLKPWRDGFSINSPRSESNLERVPVELIEEVLGPKSVTSTDKNRKIQDILGDKIGAPVELFPFLMIVLLLFLAFENLLSNKFYKSAPKPNEGAAGQPANSSS